MPNGHDKNFMRLRWACAEYRQAHKEWPTEARMDASILWDLAHLFDSNQFQSLASRIRIRTRDKSGLSVGGARGVVEYGTGAGVDEETLELTERWLGVQPLPEEEL